MPRPRGSRLQPPHALSDIPHKYRYKFIVRYALSAGTHQGWARNDNPALPCIDWLGYTDAKGYGQYRIGRRVHWVHRISYALFVGPIPEGMTVNHKCRNPSCVNPHHLELLSIAENTALGNKHRVAPIDIPV